MDSEKRSFLRDFLTCPMCLKEMTDSRLLPCHHCYCMSCLTNCAKRSAVVGKLSCLVCNSQFDIPDGGVHFFLPNNFIHTLRDALGRSSEDAAAGTLETDKALCDSEGCQKIASHFCKTGCGYLCILCKDHHSKIGICRNHQVVDAKEAGSSWSQQLPFCPRHSGHMMDLYCQDCNVPCCATCVVLNHRDHKCSELTTREKMFREKLEQILTDVDQCVNATDIAVSTTQQQEMQMEKDVEKLLQLTTYTFSKLRQYLTEREERLKEQILQEKQHSKKIVAEVKDKQELFIATMNSARICGQEMMEKATPYDFATNVDNLSQQVHLKMLSGPSNFAWQYNTCRFQMPQSHAYLAELFIKDGNTVSLQLNNTIDLGSVTCLQIMTKGNLLAAKQNDRMLYAYSADGKLISSLNFNVMTKNIIVYPTDNYSEIFGTASSSDSPKKEKTLKTRKQSDFLSGFSFPIMQDQQTGAGSFVFGKPLERLADTVYKAQFNPQTSSMTSSTSSRLPWAPTSLAVVKNYLMVTDTTGKIHMLDRNYLRTSSSMALPDGICAEQIACDPNGMGYVILDKNSHQLVWIDEEKTQVKQKSRADGLTMFTGDIQGMFLALSSQNNDRVLLIDGTGTTRAYLVPESFKLIKPHVLCLDKENHLLYVAHNADIKTEVVALKYPEDIEAEIRDREEHLKTVRLTISLPQM